MAAVLVVLVAVIGVSVTIIAARPQHNSSADLPKPSAATPAHNGGETFVLPASVASTLRNAVLHWTGTSYVDKAGSADPYNGKQTASDIRAQTDATGAVVKIHAVYTAPDGTPFQELLQDTSHTLRVFGPAYAAVFPTAQPLASSTPTPAGSSTARCQSGQGGLNTSRSQDLLPPFVDPTAPLQQGLQLSQASSPAPQFPMPTTPPSITPTRTYAPTGTVAIYTKQITQVVGQPETREVAVQADGRIVQLQDTITDAQGQILSQTRQGYGPLQVYNATAVPASVFALSSFGQEACHA